MPTSHNLPSVVNTRARRPVPKAETRRTAAMRAPQDVARGRPRLTVEDAYVEAMLADMARQFLTEGDNRIYTPRLPSPFRRALCPSPAGQARRGIPYTQMQVQDGDDSQLSALARVRGWVAAAWRRLTGEDRAEGTAVSQDIP